MAMYVIGGVRCQLHPFNVDEAERVLTPVLARHEVMGTVTQHEKTGEPDEKLRLSGKIFPRRFGGEAELATLKSLASTSQPIMVTQGNSVAGWYVIGRIKDKGRFLDRRGVGRMIDIDIELERTASPTFNQANVVDLAARLFTYG